MIQNQLSTYIINLPQRTDRLTHIENQFKGRDEFSVSIIEACEHENGAIGLWNSIYKIIEIGISNEKDWILICEDDHQFTKDYNRDFLFNNIQSAEEKGAELISGGIGGFSYALPISKNLFWIDHFISAQFLIIHKDFFHAIKNEPFTEYDTADGKFSTMTIHKMVIFPFISTQKEFGYSNITKTENRESCEKLFVNTALFLDKIQKVYYLYQS